MNKNCPFCLLLFLTNMRLDRQILPLELWVFDYTHREVQRLRTLLHGHPVTLVGAGNGFPALFFIVPTEVLSFLSIKWD